MVPSGYPTSFPTFLQQSRSVGYYFQGFEIGNDQIFGTEEVLAFVEVMERYTMNITTGEQYQRINTTCTLLQQTVISRRRLEETAPSTSPQQPAPVNNVEYRLYWMSDMVNVTLLPAKFRAFVDGNLDDVANDLFEAGLNVTTAQRIFTIRVTESPTIAPTFSQFPSSVPSEVPTEGPSFKPSGGPSFLPTLNPTMKPSLTPSLESNEPTNIPPNLLPTNPVTIAPSPAPTQSPTPPPTKSPAATSISNTIIAVVCVAVGAGVLVALFIFYRQRKNKREQQFQSGTAMKSGRQLSINTGPYNGRYNDTPRSDDNVVGIASPSDSILSHPSMISAGISAGGDSLHEQDGAHHMADEFDQYKDQNLEKMRNEVEGTLSGADGMMSQAMFLAFMVNEDESADPNELYWGGSGDPIEIEASALCEVNDWLKRKEGASLEERYVLRDAIAC